MALPVAQLGYMPQAQVPHVGTYTKRNMWEEIAQQALSAAVSAGVGNAMSRDYASQAAGEQLQQPVTVTPETADQTMPTAPTNAPWYSKVLQGPQMDAKAYAQRQATQNASKEAAKGRAFTATENKADRNVRTSEGEAERQSRAALQQKQISQAADEFGKTHNLRTQEFGLQTRLGESRMSNDAAHTALEGVKVANDTTRTQATSGVTGAQERAAVDLQEAYGKYLMDYARQALTAQVLGKPLPPAMSIQDFIGQYQQMRSGVGLQQFPR